LRLPSGSHRRRRCRPVSSHHRMRLLHPSAGPHPLQSLLLRRFFRPWTWFRLCSQSRLLPGYRPHSTFRPRSSCHPLCLHRLPPKSRLFLLQSSSRQCSQFHSLPCLHPYSLFRRRSTCLLLRPRHRSWCRGAKHRSDPCCTSHLGSRNSLRLPLDSYQCRHRPRHHRSHGHHRRAETGSCSNPPGSARRRFSWSCRSARRGNRHPSGTDCGIADPWRT